MTDADSFKLWLVAAEQLGELPPIVYFSPEHELRSIEIIGDLGTSGWGEIAFLELLTATVRGAQWSGQRTETFRAAAIVERLIQAGSFETEELFSCLTAVAAAELDLTEPARGWWLLHRDEVCRPFASRGIAAVDLPDDMLISNISAENWDHLEGLMAYGLPRSRIDTALAAHPSVVSGHIVPRWRRMK
jgi:hypothetical protein